MLDWIPGQIWLLLLIGLLAFPAVSSVYQEISAARADAVGMAAGAVTEPWRPSRRLIGCILLLTGLFALAVFSFTQTAQDMVRSPSFLRLLMAALAAFGGYDIMTGLISGHIKPMWRGNFGPYARASRPGWYWVSVVWNGAITLLLMFAAFYWF